MSGITSTNATLEAKINPNGFRAHYQFQIVTDPDEYASEILCPEPPRGLALCIGEYAEGPLSIGFIFKEVTTVSRDLSSEGVTLQPGTTYHYRVLAARAVTSEDTIEWEEPIVIGADQTFTTPKTNVPSIDKESVSGITSTNAILETQVSPHGGFGAYVQFQLVIDPEEFASEILCRYPPEPGPICLGEYAEGALVILRLFEEPHQVSLDLSDPEVGSVPLQPGTTYHYRVLAARAITSEDTIEWEEPTVFGPDQTFTTPSLSGVPLTIAKTGQGTVTSSPAGIECTGAKTGAECEGKFEENELVTLTASPAAGYAFGAWGYGCLEHVGLTCKVKMDKAKTVKATFVSTPSLSIEKAGSGYGKVSATGISCDESCSKESSAIKAGTAVMIKATPAKGSEFAGFEGGSGNASSCGESCSFTISETSSVKVKFSPIPTKTLTVKLTGPGAYRGKVSGKGVTVKGLLSTAIGCGSGCTTATESFFASGETELVAAASTGYKFTGWTVSGGSAGNCTDTTSPCKLATDADKTVEAEFK